MLSWEEILTNSEGTQRPRPNPHAAPGAWLFPAVGKCAKALGVCPGRVRGLGAPRAFYSESGWPSVTSPGTSRA